MRRFFVTLEGRDPMLVELVSDDGENAVVRISDPGSDEPPTTLELSLVDLRDQRFLLRQGETVETVDVLDTGRGLEVLAGDDSGVLTVTDERDTWLGTGGAAGGAGVVTVAMPGKVVAVDVVVGDEVVRGQRLLIIEAMKMENDVKSPKDGVVTAIRVAPGTAVESGEALIELE